MATAAAQATLIGLADVKVDGKRARCVPLGQNGAFAVGGQREDDRHAGSFKKPRNSYNARALEGMNAMLRHSEEAFRREEAHHVELSAFKKEMVAQKKEMLELTKRQLVAQEQMAKNGEKETEANLIRANALMKEAENHAKEIEVHERESKVQEELMKTLLQLVKDRK